jgi:hypothetical protein
MLPLLGFLGLAGAFLRVVWVLPMHVTATPNRDELERAMRARELVLRTAEWCGVLVLVVAALPVLALAGLVARGLAVVLGLVSVVGLAVLCGVHPGVRQRVCRSLGMGPESGPALRRAALVDVAGGTHGHNPANRPEAAAGRWRRREPSEGSGGEWPQAARSRALAVLYDPTRALAARSASGRARWRRRRRGGGDVAERS